MSKLPKPKVVVRGPGESLGDYLARVFAQIHGREPNDAEMADLRGEPPTPAAPGAKPPFSD